MSYCTSCGRNLSEGARFCESCGVAAMSSSTSGGATPSSGACPSCGKSGQTEHLYCTGCGARISGPPPLPPGNRAVAGIPSRPLVGPVLPTPTGQQPAPTLSRTGESTAVALTGQIIGFIMLAAFVWFVFAFPMQTCGHCHGIGSFLVSCTHCGGDGKQTFFEVLTDPLRQG